VWVGKEEISMSADNEDLVRRYVEEVYDQRRLEVADEIFASDFTLRDPDLPRGARGLEGVKKGRAAWASTTRGPNEARA
jgi:hypothetical protein